MSCVKRSVRLEVRRDTAANWANKNPVLLSGEPGFEIDTSRLKVGNGVTPWNALLYIGAGTTPTSVLDGGGPAGGPPGGSVFDMGSVT